LICTRGLAWLEASGEGRDWFTRLPELLDECAERGSLTLGEPFPYAFASLARPATRDDGSAVVLKIQFPDRESEHEAAALELVDGDDAVRLLAYDAGPRALLLERAGRPFEPALLEAALETIETLSGSRGNTCWSTRTCTPTTWSAPNGSRGCSSIPSPLSVRTGVRRRGTVRGGELGRSREAVVDRLDRLTVEFLLDRERARGWALAQTIAWAFDGDQADLANVEIARWLWEAG
jgi:streptomycin 6-kinase